MQGYGQLDDAEVRPEMPAILRKDGNQPLAYFRRQFQQLGGCELLDLRGTFHRIKVSAHRLSVRRLRRPRP